MRSYKATKLLFLIFLVPLFTPIFGIENWIKIEDDADSIEDINNYNYCAIHDLKKIRSQSDKEFGCDDSCNSRLKIANLNARSIKTHEAEAAVVNAQSICTQKLDAQDGCVNNLKVQGKVVSSNVDCQNFCTNNSQVNNNICANSAMFNSLECVNRYRATVTYSNKKTHNLGTNLNFDLIIDDPNKNVKLGLLGTTYTVPKSGYYIITFQIEQTNVTPIPIATLLMLPTSNPQIIVDGNIYRQSFLPYTVQNVQIYTLTTLISLNAGNVISFNYQIFTVNDAGFIPISGTVDLIGNGTENKTFFKIHYLSSNSPAFVCGNCSISGATGCSLPCN